MNQPIQISTSSYGDSSSALFCWRLIFETAVAIQRCWSWKGLFVFSPYHLPRSEKSFISLILWLHLPGYRNTVQWKRIHFSTYLWSWFIPLWIISVHRHPLRTPVIVSVKVLFSRQTSSRVQIQQSPVHQWLYTRRFVRYGQRCISLSFIHRKAKLN